jgi:hypothetical protein
VALVQKEGCVIRGLTTIRDIYPDSTIAVIGSAPSAVTYADIGYDATIAVNGASQLLYKARGPKYFLSGDAGASRQSWYALIPRGVVHILRPIAAIYSPVFVGAPSQRAALIRVWEDYLDHHPKQVRVIPNRTVREGIRQVPLRDLEYDNPFYEVLLKLIPPCSPHVIFNVGLPQPITKHMHKLRRGPTSAGCALQVAYLMGASTIHMYGVEMTNQGVPYAEGNYFYVPLPDEKGVTTSEQLTSIEGVIQDLCEVGITVSHVGHTRIRNVSIVEPADVRKQLVL